MTKSTTDSSILDDDAVAEERCKSAIRKLQDTAWNCGTDEFKEGVSDTACNRRYDAMVTARAECVSAVDTLCATVRALRYRLDLVEKAFELEGSLKLSEVGDLNALQVIKKLTNLQSQLEQVTKERDDLRQRERGQLTTVIEIRGCDKCDLCEDHQ